jgi:hypothetical protein
METFKHGLRLPEQIILDIVFSCDVATLKSLRLAHRLIRDLVDTYQNSICLNASKILFDSEEMDVFQPLDKSHSTLLTLFALEYRVRTAQWLAAVAVENIQEDEDLCHVESYGNIGAKEPRGDPVRAYVAVGFGVLWRLRDIAQKVVEETITVDVSDSRKRLYSSTRGLSWVQRLEMTIKAQQLEYVCRLPFRGRESYGYYLMHGMVAGTFADRVFDDPRGRNSDWRTGNEFAIGNSWLNWLILREGPGFFARAWASKEGNKECLKLIVTEWSKRSKEQLLVEHAAAKEVKESLLRSSNATHEMTRYIDLLGWARSGRQIERIFTRVNFYLGRLLPQDLIKSIEEEYTDDSS